MMKILENRKGKKLSQKDFETTKTLLQTSMSQKDIGKMVDRSQSTVNLIAKSEDLKDYKRLSREKNESYKDKKEEQEASPAMSSSLQTDGAVPLTAEDHLLEAIQSLKSAIRLLE